MENIVNKENRVDLLNIAAKLNIQNIYSFYDICSCLGRAKRNYYRCLRQRQASLGNHLLQWQSAL